MRRRAKSLLRTLLMLASPTNLAHAPSEALVAMREGKWQGIGGDVGLAAVDGPLCDVHEERARR